MRAKYFASAGVRLINFDEATKISASGNDA
jgi:hypothetical protein